ncbi:MAG: hypothetical protein K6G58_07165 [Lachnospiraceae bacterium]|nr:hypothetical protein [Lachnospiraceae bacterium]
MDQEEERVRYLSRVGREKIFKYGTYNMTSPKPVTQDHPFYAKRDDAEQDEAGLPEEGYDMPAEAAPADDEPVDPEELARQVMSSNFKVGLSQEEVDALLNGI